MFRPFCRPGTFVHYDYLKNFMPPLVTAVPDGEQNHHILAGFVGCRE